MALLCTLLPSEICTLIGEMNPEHRERFRGVFDDLERISVMRRLDELWVEVSVAGNHSFYDEFLAQLGDHVQVVSRLIKCKCCSRHQRNKPFTEGEFNINMPGAFSMRDFHKRPCLCTCRHHLRFIDRMLNKKVWDRAYNDAFDDSLSEGMTNEEAEVEANVRADLVVEEWKENIDRYLKVNI